MQEFRPHIIGTYHVSYNLKAILEHLKSENRPRSKIMLECYDPHETRSDFEIKLERIGDEVKVKNVEANAHLFFGGLYQKFSGLVEICVSYTKQDHLKFSQQEESRSAWEDYINPIILEKVLFHKPDTIVLGDTHAKYLKGQIPNSEYVFVNDKVAADLWQMKKMKSVAEALIKAKIILDENNNE